MTHVVIPEFGTADGGILRVTEKAEKCPKPRY